MVSGVEWQCTIHCWLILSTLASHCTAVPGHYSVVFSLHTHHHHTINILETSYMRTTILIVNIILCCHGEGLVCVSSVGLILVWRNIILFALINVSFQCFSVSATVTEPSSNQDNFYKTFNFLHDPSSCSFCVHSPPLSSTLSSLLSCYQMSRSGVKRENLHFILFLTIFREMF